MRARRADRRSERVTRACLRGPRLHGSGSSPGRADPDLLELLGEGVDRAGALRRSSPAASPPRARCRLLASAARKTRLRALILRFSLGAQAAFVRVHSRVRHFGGVFGFAAVRRALRRC